MPGEHPGGFRSHDKEADFTDVEPDVDVCSGRFLGVWEGRLLIFKQPVNSISNKAFWDVPKNKSVWACPKADTYYCGV